MPCDRIRRSHTFEGLRPGRPYAFQVRAANAEGLGPWSAPSEPARTLTKKAGPPPAPTLASGRPAPGPLSLWLSLSPPDDDGGDPVSALLLETREHGGAGPPVWGRCDRHAIREEHRRLDEGPGTGGDPPAPGVVALVSGLKPRTFYSFRATAVNSHGAGEAGPPCRRVRTSPPRPPSWNDGQGGFQSGVPGGSDRGLRPSVTCSELGECRVTWDEPFCNGSPTESYTVESAKIPSDTGSACLAAGSAGVPQPGMISATSGPCDPHHLVGRGHSPEAFVENGVSEELLTEVESRVLPAMTQSVVMRALCPGSAYVFRVSGTNAAGKGEPSPWSRVVWIPHAG